MEVSLDLHLGLILLQFLVLNNEIIFLTIPKKNYYGKLLSLDERQKHVNIARFKKLIAGLRKSFW